MDNPPGNFNESLQRISARTPDSAYFTWKGSILEGTPKESDKLIEVDWRQRPLGRDSQLERAATLVETDLSENSQAES